MNFQIPITKIDEVKKEVWGVISDETPDKQGEIMDYDSSLEYFKAWSGEIEKNTNGKSFGNCRLMHQPNAIGKVIAINFNDATKSIEAGVKVVDDSAWQLVEENVLSAFSIGGSYAKRWSDGEYMRYTAIPAEVSLVDNPANPSATISVIKSDGTTEQREFKHKEAEQLEVNKDVLANIKKAVAENDLAKAFSFEEIRDRIGSAITAKVRTPYNYGYGWVVATFSDVVIVQWDIDGNGDSNTVSMPYTIDDSGVVTLGEPTEVHPQYVPIKAETKKAMEGNDLEKDEESLELEKTEKDQEGKKDPAEKEDKAEKADTPPDDAKEAPKEDAKEDEKANDRPKDDKKADKAAEPDNLEKAGAKHSKDHIAALQKMAHDLNTMGGACKCDKCTGMYKGDMALAAQTDGMEKAVEMNQQLSKAMEGLQALQKGFDALKADNEALSKKVSDLENQPLPGGPVLAGSVVVNKSLGGEQHQPQEFGEIEAWDMIINKAHDPQVVQNARVQKAQLLMKKTLTNR